MKTKFMNGIAITEPKYLYVGIQKGVSVVLFLKTYNNCIRTPNYSEELKESSFIPFTGTVEFCHE